VTILFEKKNAQFFKKKPKQSPSQNTAKISKLIFESPKNLHQTTFKPKTNKK